MYDLHTHTHTRAQSCQLVETTNAEEDRHTTYMHIVSYIYANTHRYTHYIHTTYTIHMYVYKNIFTEITSFERNFGKADNATRNETRVRTATIPTPERCANQTNSNTACHSHVNTHTDRVITCCFTLLTAANVSRPTQIFAKDLIGNHTKLVCTHIYRHQIGVVTTFGH